MKRKFATSGIYKLGCTIPGLFAMLHWMVFCALTSCSGCRRCVVFVIIGYQWDGVRVPVPLVPGCVVGDADCREVVEVPTIIFCPSMNFLGFSIHFVVLPFEHDGIIVVFSCSSVDVSCFPMVFLPLSCAMSFTSWVIHSCMVVGNYHNFKLGFDSLYFFFTRSKTNATRAEN